MAWKAWLGIVRACAIVCALTVGVACAEFTVDGKSLAAIAFPAPDDKEAAKYLGLPEGDSFKLRQVKADLLIVQIFSMYCPLCQSDAPHVNELFQLIEKDPALRRGVKMVAIGAGNTPYEVGVFRDKFKVPFPMVPDEDFLIQQACSEDIRTPVFVLARPERDKGLKVLKTKIGKIESAQGFLKTVKAVHAKKQEK